MLASLAARQAPAQTYLVIMRDGARALSVRAAGTADLVSLDQVAPLFALTLHDDTLAAGVSIAAGRQTIVLTPNQAYASVAGRLVALSAPVVRDGKSWVVPIDFLSIALGPALGIPIEVRRGSHLILVGDVHVPQLVARLDRQGPNARLTVDVRPATPYHITREPARILIRFEASGLDLAPPGALPADLVAGVHADNATLVIDLAPAVNALPPTEDPAGAHATIDLAATSASTPAPARPAPEAQAPPTAALTPGAGIRTIVIDPGHGGLDAGAHSADGVAEKDLALALAKKLKAAIEERLGLHVLLTRDTDEVVPIDQRTSLANNNKADLFISLHADASWRATARGAQVLSLSLADYQDRLGSGFDSGVAVPLVGGGTRTIAAIPWDLAQIPYAPTSAAFAGIVEHHLRDGGVLMHDPSLLQAPLRVLAAANMPAILVEVGFLSNADDKDALSSGDLPDRIIAAILGAITDVRAGIPTSGGGGL
jgi:N-acetylmuramoyl-L-alanine amidase